jgi:hypothetical protein
VEESYDVETLPTRTTIASRLHHIRYDDGDTIDDHFLNVKAVVSRPGQGRELF